MAAAEHNTIASIHSIDFRLRENGGIVTIALESSNENTNAILSLVTDKLNEKFSELFTVPSYVSFINCRLKNEESKSGNKTAYTFEALEQTFAQIANEYANQYAFVEAAKNHLVEKDARINALTNRRTNGPQVLANEIADFLQESDMPLCEDRLAKLKEFFTKKGADISRYTG